MYFTGLQAPAAQEWAPTLTDSVNPVNVDEGLPAGTMVIGPRTWSDLDVTERQSEIYFEQGTFTGTYAGAKLQFFNLFFKKILKV